MDGVKTCVRCGVVIAYEHTADWYAYIRMKYCDRCRAEVTNEQAARRMREMRARNREKRKAEKTELQLLREKNEQLRTEVDLLRKYNMKIRERIDS